MTTFFIMVRWPCGKRDVMRATAKTWRGAFGLLRRFGVEPQRIMGEKANE